jgi:endoglucanase
VGDAGIAPGIIDGELLTPTTSGLSAPKRGGEGTLSRLHALVAAVFLVPGLAFALPASDRIATLARGVNITGWFRFPVSREPAALRSWLRDPAIDDLRRGGFTFARLAIDPAVVETPATRDVLVEEIRRLQRHRLGVVVSPHPVAWSVDTNQADRARLTEFWRGLAPALRGLPPDRTFPEVLNEPVFHDDPAAWWHWQQDLHAAIRAHLPQDTIILTGHDWGGIDGLRALAPLADGNVVYSFHFYEPAELTSLAAWRPGLDRAALARLPFPERDTTSCGAIADTASDSATRDLIRFWCATNWSAERVRSRLESAAVWAREHGVALLAGEFGASAALNADARLAWLSLVRRTCEVNGIGWALWGYDDVMGFNLPRPPGDRPALDHSVLEALGLSLP